MKKIIIVAVLSLLAFGASLIGMYVAMPMVAPELVEAVRDSVDAAENPASLTAALSDSLVADSARVQPSDTIAQLRDSLDAVRDTLVQAQSRSADLEDELAAARRQLSSQEREQLRTAELGRTLSKLEDENLKAILERLDLPVLERLYREASGRERKRLLQSMPPDYAARFVGRLMARNEGPPTQPPPVPSTAVSN